MNETPSKLYKTIGTLAIIGGATFSAFSAKMPSTFAMWATAYLVLVVGVVQVFFGITVAQLLPKNAHKLLYWVFGLFNVGNAIVIISTALKYNGHEQHVLFTVLGGVLVLASLTLLAWHMRLARPSWMKVLTYVVVATLGVSVFVGCILAGWK